MILGGGSSAVRVSEPRFRDPRRGSETNAGHHPPPRVRDEDCPTYDPLARENRYLDDAQTFQIPFLKERALAWEQGLRRRVS